jgi:AraC family transcriptional regulator, regulatory protein of adaptative response / methylated-DNA-[protein]-cysteine methyltransferase
MPSNTNAAIETDPRWQAVMRRDPASDGRFFYSVRTTGVFCRPSCAARQPNPKNVAFHASIADAQAAGFRPCKRCRPDEPTPAKRHAATVARICRQIENSEAPIPLAALAKAAGLSPHHFHRLFKSVTGLTPQDYARAHRAGKIRNQLSRSNTVTDAIFHAGFQSSNPFYAKSDEMLGMTPASYRKGGAQQRIQFAVADCSLGKALVAESGKGVCAIFLGGDAKALQRELADRFPKAELVQGDKAFGKRIAQVIGFIEAPGRSFDLPLDVQGTAFQQKVWNALRRIPAGATASYADIAHAIGSPKAVRAVAGACGANPVAVAIPCHRVVAKDGGLGGYHWGAARKRKLLDREKAA